MLSLSMTAKGLRRIVLGILSSRFSVPAKFFNSRMPRSLACEELTPRSFLQGPLSTLDTEYDENKSRAGRPRHTSHSRCTCTDGHVTKLITPAGVVGLVVLSKLPHIL